MLYKFQKPQTTDIKLSESSQVRDYIHFPMIKCVKTHSEACDS